MTTATTSVLRFITCGSVDDGKSTLIGRLLYDAKGVFADQIAAVGRSKHQRATSEADIDLALLTDGLEAEREQGITIDVAYRYFATPKRKFIIADTPGHEQYTRNMVTGASTADAALLLIDPTRVVGGQLLEQTKRHAAIAKLLGIKHLIAVINKMDLIEYSQDKVLEITALLDTMAKQLDLPTLQVIPVSALKGDNVVQTSQNMAWYSGPALLPLLEQLPSEQSLQNHQTDAAKLRFTVQYVIRADGSTANDFRGFAGHVASGTIKVGDSITVSSSGAQAIVARLHTYDGDLPLAQAGTAVTVVLDRDVDVSRGDTLIQATDNSVLSKQFLVDLCWLDTQALSTSRKYWFKHGARTGYAKIQSIEQVLDIHHLSYADFEHSQAQQLGLNAIARVQLHLQAPVLADDYSKHRETGALILIDTASHQTVAACMVRANS